VREDFVLRTFAASYGSVLAVLEGHGEQMTISALVPAYKPDVNLVEVVRSLVASKLFETVVVVDDGGGEAFRAIFEEVARQPTVTVLRHAVNLGKGAALKTGMNHLLVTRPDDGCVTADADGQHAPADIARVARALAERPTALVLGARHFDGKVPFKSRVGNTLTRHVFKAIIGRKLIDTQTGLRGIPPSLMQQLLAIPSNRYEFEMDMLVLASQQHLDIREEVIQTIYVADNAGTHFDPFFDSIRIYFVLLRYALSSGAGYLVDIIAFQLGFLAFQSILIAHIIARLCALPVNFWLVRGFAFDSRGRVTIQLPLYILVVIVSGVVSYFCQVMLVDNFRLPALVAKVSTEFVLFFANFLILRDWVFRRRTATAEAS
jgi:glycosyltransferase involved in cell wall biosynthesis